MGSSEGHSASVMGDIFADTFEDQLDNHSPCCMQDQNCSRTRRKQQQTR